LIDKDRLIFSVIFLVFFMFLRPEISHTSTSTQLNSLSSVLQSFWLGVLYILTSFADYQTSLNTTIQYKQYVANTVGYCIVS